MESRYGVLRIIVVVSLLLSAIPVSAQLDSSFVETFASTTRVNGGLRYRDNSATFSVGNQETLKLGNRGLALRLGGRYKWIGYTFSIPLSDLGTDSELGNAKSLGANIQFYRDKFYLNANLRRTIGFEREAVGEETIFRDDIRFFNALLFGFRILNSKTFSLRSSFKLRNRQLRSAGSLLVAGAIHRQILKADSLIIPLRNNGSTTIDRFSQTKVGVGLGYAHTFVFGKLFFATPLLVVGPEIRFIDYDPIASARELERFRVSPRIRGRLAVGVNGRRNYAALTGAYLPSADASEKLNTRVDEVQIELVLGHRIGIED